MWLGREDSNLRMQEPKSCVLPLDDAPLLTDVAVEEYEIHDGGNDETRII